MRKPTDSIPHLEEMIKKKKKKGRFHILGQKVSKVTLKPFLDGDYS